MGKKKAKHRKCAGAGSTPTTASGTTPYTVDQLLDRVDALMETFEVELAHQFAKRALTMDPSNLRALETMALILLEGGDPGTANEVRETEAAKVFMPCLFTLRHSNFI